MAMRLLGETIDIHTGGMDHITVHHNNEIAQSESVTEKMFAAIWMHAAFLTIDNEKISKSLGNVYTIADIEERGHDPIALRYLFLQASYRTPLSFSFASLAAAEKALGRLRNEYAASRSLLSFFKRSPDESYKKIIDEAIADDLNTAKVIATMWEVLHDTKLSQAAKHNTLRYANELLGILEERSVVHKTDPIPEEVKHLLRERDQARAEKDYARSDKIRDRIHALGYEVNDTADGSTATKK